MNTTIIIILIVATFAGGFFIGRSYQNGGLIAINDEKGEVQYIRRTDVMSIRSTVEGPVCIGLSNNLYMLTQSESAEIVYNLIYQ